MRYGRTLPILEIALWRSVRIGRLVGMLIGNVLEASVGRTLVPCAIGGFTYTAANLQPTSWLWTAYGMLLGTALGLILEEEPVRSEMEQFNRLDHAAMAILLAIACHLSIIMS